MLDSNQRPSALLGVPGSGYGVRESRFRRFSATAQAAPQRVELPSILGVRERVGGGGGGGVGGPQRVELCLGFGTGYGVGIGTSEVSRRRRRPLRSALSCRPYSGFWVRVRGAGTTIRRFSTTAQAAPQRVELPSNLACEFEQVVYALLRRQTQSGGQLDLRLKL